MLAHSHRLGFTSLGGRQIWCASVRLTRLDRIPCTPSTFQAEVASLLVNLRKVGLLRTCALAPRTRPPRQKWARASARTPQFLLSQAVRAHASRNGIGVAAIRRLRRNLLDLGRLRDDAVSEDMHMAMLARNGVDAARSLMTSVVASVASTDSTPVPSSWEPKLKEA